MTDKRKDEMPDEIYVWKNCNLFQCTDVPFIGEYKRIPDTKYIRSDVPDDVAALGDAGEEFIKWYRVKNSADPDEHMRSHEDKYLWYARGACQGYEAGFIRAAITPSAEMDSLRERIKTLEAYTMTLNNTCNENLEGWRAVNAEIDRIKSTPSAEVEYWKDKCYTAEGDAEIHAQCYDKVFDEKKALEAEVRALKSTQGKLTSEITDLVMDNEKMRDDIKTAIAQLHEGNKALAMRVLEEALNHTGGK